MVCFALGVLLHNCGSDDVNEGVCYLFFGSDSYKVSIIVVTYFAFDMLLSAMCSLLNQDIVLRVHINFPMLMLVSMRLLKVLFQTSICQTFNIWGWTRMPLLGYPLVLIYPAWYSWLCLTIGWAGRRRCLDLTCQTLNCFGTGFQFLDCGTLTIAYEVTKLKNLGLEIKSVRGDACIWLAKPWRIGSAMESYQSISR